MSYFGNNLKNESKFYKRTWFKIIAAIIILLVIGGGIFAWKAGSILNKVTKGSLIQSLIHNIPGVKDELEGEAEGRINILLIGMRGENMPGGGKLADTIIVASILSKENKVAMISIPRDLYVTVPGTQDKQKINAVYSYGEDKKSGQGLIDMKTIVGEVTGLPIHYAVDINFAGFKQLIDAIGGIDITLDKPFEEPLQFNEPHVCDSQIFTVPFKNERNLQMYECKFDVKPATVSHGISYTLQPPTYCNNRPNRSGYMKVVKQYPLCTNPNTECGGDFKLPAGRQTLNGEQALCFARSRVTTNDFERAKHQQLVIQLVKEKMLSVGTLSDFGKINGILNSLGDNVRTDMALWEMQRLYEIYKQIPNAEIYQRVLEDSEEGLLYYPGESAAGYILLPRGDNYDRIHQMARDIFNSAARQSDINPKI